MLVDGRNFSSSSPLCIAAILWHIGQVIKVMSKRANIIKKGKSTPGIGVLRLLKNRRRLGVVIL